MHSPSRWLYLFVLALALCPGRAYTGEEQRRFDGMGDAEIEQRLAYIEARFAAARPGAGTWQHGWTGFHAASAAAQGLLAIDADDSDEEVYYLVGAAKSAGALSQMLIRPLPSVQGTNRFEAMPSGTRAERIARLAAGEDLLRENAARAGTRTAWKRHLIGIGANLLGGTLIAAFGDGDDALTSTLLGIAVSEANIWTEPSRAIADLEDYRNNGWAPRQNRVNWQIIPAGPRVVLKVDF